MSAELTERIQTAQKEVEPQYKALRAVSSALQQAMKLAAEEQTDALAMQKALGKLQQAAAAVENGPVQAATAAFAEATQAALDALAFEFARDLKETFETRGLTVEGRPPTLVVNSLVLQIDIGSRKAQWYYGKEALTRPIPLSISALLQAYDAQRKAIVERTIDAPAFVAELHKAWQDLLAKRTARPAGGRISLVELYSQVVLNRQSVRFWNAPSRATFRDYDRALFVRDLVLAHATPQIEVDGKQLHLRLGGATKNQADSPTRSVWLPQSALDGEYYASLTFEEA